VLGAYGTGSWREHLLRQKEGKGEVEGYHKGKISRSKSRAYDVRFGFKVQMEK
jgi:hypothetical protein